MALDPLVKMSDDELRSLIGQATAELTHRERVRTADFKDAVRLIDERWKERHEKGPSPIPALSLRRG